MSEWIPADAMLPTPEFERLNCDVLQKCHAGDIDDFLAEVRQKKTTDEPSTTMNDTSKKYTNWRKEIAEEMRLQGETWADVEVCAITEEQLDAQFYHGYGSAAGAPFTVWTKNRVYFPAVYDGAEWAESVARNPDGKATDHVGGQ